MSDPRLRSRPPVRRRPSRAVYRRRRLAVAATAVLLVVAAVDLVRGGDEPVPSDTAARSASEARPSGSADRARGSSSEEPAVGPSRSRRPTRPRATPTPAPAPEPAEPQGACDDTDVAVRPEVGTVYAGGKVRITLALSTTGSAACTWTIGPEHLAYNVYDADGVETWSSAQCPDQVAEAEVVVRRDVLTTYALNWSGRASSKDCPASMEHVAPGEYAVQAAAIGGEPSEMVAFELRDPSTRATSGPTVPSSGSSKKKSR